MILPPFCDSNETAAGVAYCQQRENGVVPWKPSVSRIKSPVINGQGSKRYTAKCVIPRLAATKKCKLVGKPLLCRQGRNGLVGAPKKHVCPAPKNKLGTALTACCLRRQAPAVTDGCYHKQTVRRNRTSSLFPRPRFFFRTTSTMTGLGGVGGTPPVSGYIPCGSVPCTKSKEQVDAGGRG